jgi:branched-chain amino acid transport system permease protein
VDLLAQYVMNGVMLGLMYALVALGFTLFFGVLDVVQFAHGDVLTAGAFVGLASYAALVGAGVDAALPQLIVVVLAATV